MPASRSPSPAGLDLDLPRVVDSNAERRRERERQAALRRIEAEMEGPKQKADPKLEIAKMANTKAGGVYIPPARLRAMQEAASHDKASTEFQRMSWDALRKSINGLINKVSIANIKHIVPELFGENLIRGKGLYCRSIMKAQASSLPFTPLLAALTAIVNTKLPQVGELLLTRLINQFRRAFKRNDKTVCLATTNFIAHLCNQQVAHEIVALQMLVLLLEQPTDDSVEIAVGFMREVGAFLAETSPKANNGVYERFRAILHEGAIDKRIQYMIEVLFQVRKDKYKDNPILSDGLDLVEEDEQITHRISLDDELDVQEKTNIFKYDPDFIENEDKYKDIKNEILGDSDDDSDESGSEEDTSDEEESAAAVAQRVDIQDQTQTNLVNLRRTIYLTIMNSLNYEEAIHKLMRIDIQEGQEIEMVNMIIECSSQEKSYNRFYGLMGERLAKLNRTWCDCAEQAFTTYYETIFRYETRKLRNIACFFGHLFSTDAISWGVFHAVKMNEEDTNSSSRIFIQTIFQEMSQMLGMKKLVERFQDRTMQGAYVNMFPVDNPKNTRFAINYFTAIGLGAVTETMREYLKNAPKLLMEKRRAALEAGGTAAIRADPAHALVAGAAGGATIVALVHAHIPPAL
uniref:MI domain-containing protein n=1 Tax=Bartheletia paradoxa TaxID=669517 RepID=A0A2D0XI66_9BASI|nr:hypothetical protein SPAR03995 [Bartheletia paradoxa]